MVVASARTVTRVGERGWAVLEPADVADATVGEGDDLPAVDAPAGVIGGWIGGHGHGDGHAVPDGGDLLDSGTHSSVKPRWYHCTTWRLFRHGGFGSPGAPHVTSGHSSSVNAFRSCVSNAVRRGSSSSGSGIATSLRVISPPRNGAAVCQGRRALGCGRSECHERSVLCWP